MAEGLYRFIFAQYATYDLALHELKSGKKSGHWMWYIFPQLRGLGNSSNAQYYGIRDINEAKEYVSHPVLGERLVTVCRVLLELDTLDIDQVLEYPDGLKLRSSMTLFMCADPDTPEFEAVLSKYFGGVPDALTLRMLGIEG